MSVCTSAAQCWIGNSLIFCCLVKTKPLRLKFPPLLSSACTCCKDGHPVTDVVLCALRDVQIFQTLCKMFCYTVAMTPCIFGEERDYLFCCFYLFANTSITFAIAQPHTIKWLNVYKIIYLYTNTHTHTHMFCSSCSYCVHQYHWFYCLF